MTIDNLAGRPIRVRSEAELDDICREKGLQINLLAAKPVAHGLNKERFVFRDGKVVKDEQQS